MPTVTVTNMKKQNEKEGQFLSAVEQPRILAQYPEKELLELIDKIKRQKCEKQHVEVKKALGGTTKKLYDTLSSFSKLV